MNITLVGKYMKDLTWFCEICKKERPDSLIAICTGEHKSFSAIKSNFAVNVKYCIDNPTCMLKATKKAKDEIHKLYMSFKNFYPEGQIILKGGDNNLC